MAKELSIQTMAFKKLLKMAMEGSFDLYTTMGEKNEKKVWPVCCLDPLERLVRRSQKMTRQEALNETLMNLPLGDLPKSKAQMERERKVIQLTLWAGADPNCSNRYGNAFNEFWENRKFYGALELAKDIRFTLPPNLEALYQELEKNLTLGGKTRIEASAMAQRQSLIYQKELLTTLLQKQMFPCDKQVLKKLSQIVLEEGSSSVGRKTGAFPLRRPQTLRSLCRIVQIKRKEKN